jgi:hypothetical protein
VEVNFAQGLESEAKIEVDGGMVGGDNVQAGGDVAITMIVEELGDESGGVSMAAMVGMGTDSADFAPGIEQEALAGHGDEVVAVWGGVPDAVIIAHDADAAAEEAGKGDICELGDGGRVGASERDDLELIEVTRGREDCVGRKDHLNCASIMEAFDGGRYVAENLGSLLRFHERVKIVKSGNGVFRKGGHGRDV